MNELATIIYFISLGMVILQILPVLNFVSLFHSLNPKPVQDKSLSKAAVVLALRGADPFLRDCIYALLNQNYPQYEVHIVVDSREDPAWASVHDILQRSQPTNVRVSPLLYRYETCSLKCSALVQAISQLDDSYDVVALLDADVIPHPNWLRELVAPFADERVGATTGNRWYMPEVGNWGSLVRYLWNMVAVVFMYLYQCPWGGSMALKLSTLHKAHLLEKWQQGLSVDTPIHKALQEIGLKVKFVPTVMMSNLEECNFNQCFRFVRRQLIVMRLYNPKWMLIVVAVFINTLAFVSLFLLLLIAILTSNFDTAIWMTVKIFIYVVVMALPLVLVEQGIRKVIRAQGKPTVSFSVIRMAKILVAIPLTQLIYAATTVAAMLAQSVEWRGIKYQIRSPWNIHLTEYRPYQHSKQLVNTKISL